MHKLIYVFFLVLLTGMAQKTGNPDASKEEDIAEDKVVESMEMCDPKETTKMPETFY